MLVIGNRVGDFAAQRVGQRAIEPRFMPVWRQFDHAGEVFHGPIVIRQFAPVQPAPAVERRNVDGMQFEGLAVIVHRQLIFALFAGQVAKVAMKITAPEVQCGAQAVKRVATQCCSSGGGPVSLRFIIPC